MSYCGGGDDCGAGDETRDGAGADLLEDVSLDSPSDRFQRDLQSHQTTSSSSSAPQANGGERKCELIL